MAMSVSVVMPVYARQASGEAALRSALAQTPSPEEAIAVDDASPEPFVLPPDLASDPRIRVIRHERNLGAAAARNTGIRAASSSWIAFLDSDDLWLPGKLAAQLDIARTAPALSCVVTGFRRIYAASGLVREEVPVPAETPRMLASGCWFCPGSTALIARETFACVGFFDERLCRLEDLDWFLRLALSGGRVVVARHLGAEIAIGLRPSVERVSDAAEKIAAKWLQGGTMLEPAVARRLAAYLDLERAAALRNAHRPIGSTVRLARSLVLRPRLRLQLERWWRPLPRGVGQ